MRTTQAVGKYWQNFALNLDDAYRQGHFQNSITRWRLMSVIERKYPELHTYGNPVNRGMWTRNKYLTWIPHNMTIPKYTIMYWNPKDDSDERNGFVLARGWQAIIDQLKSQGFPVSEEEIEAAK